jgi:hypothetical protein
MAQRDFEDVLAEFRQALDKKIGAPRDDAEKSILVQARSHLGALDDYARTTQQLIRDEAL